MEKFKGKVAVITGAASGIGFALAERAVQEGMKVVMADIEGEALHAAAGKLKALSPDVLAVPTDVSNADDVDVLARVAFDRFRAVHLLCNNAGVAFTAPVWEVPLADWEWILGVNLLGVVHGIRTFVPIMLNRKDECAIVNTASLFGLVSPAGYGAYNATKHAVVAISETLKADLQAHGSPMQVAVLCPGLINTRIADSFRNRPEELPPGVTANREFQENLPARRAALAGGQDPADVANLVFTGLRRGDFYLFTHPEQNGQIRERFAAMLGS